MSVTRRKRVHNCLFKSWQSKIIIPLCLIGEFIGIMIAKKEYDRVYDRYKYKELNLYTHTIFISV